jgi:aerobic-type carbon monoxide dehydrogenase small subunit (CoxS/CutS family)
VQCGFCTGGMIVSARPARAQSEAPSTNQEGIEGNFCRCRLPAIIEAVVDVRQPAGKEN